MLLTCVSHAKGSDVDEEDLRGRSDLNEVDFKLG